MEILHSFLKMKVDSHNQSNPGDLLITAFKNISRIYNLISKNVRMLGEKVNKNRM